MAEQLTEKQIAEFKEVKKGSQFNTRSEVYDCEISVEGLSNTNPTLPQSTRQSCFWLHPHQRVGEMRSLGQNPTEAELQDI
ncbi:hypothetical protein SLEP1_g17297 [Rubroshorea leprosula]|uniref:Uncharacterized protein n=1 Tax=Rubroshorea leprosula TaxID=152421 RepID=A0AAV5J2V6_9ROSI|nr:hypothetical protein SLEP1_g17297 [Rubroshorea leprosula]